MATRRLVVNLVAFLAVTVALIAYGVVDLLGNPLESPTTVSAVFPDASGLFTNFSVNLNGVDVGSVSSVHLAPGGARVTMAIDHGVTIPRDVVATIGVANDLGEQVVDLTTTGVGGSTPLPSGAVVPVVPGGIPQEVGQVVASATRLLKAIPSGALNHLLAELAGSLNGRAGDLRTIIAAGTAFSQEFLQYQQQFNALLANAPPVLDVVGAEGPQIRQALANTQAILQVLAQHRSDLTGALHNGATAFGQLGGLVATRSPDLACLIHDLSSVSANLAQPSNLANLSTSLGTNRYFFGAVSSVAVKGTAKALTAGAADNTDQYFLRTRLLIPPASPSGIAYPAQQGLPVVKPGAGCSTELGQGVGPATQPGFTPAAGGSVSPAPASESLVRGGGDANPVVDSASTAYAVPTAPGSMPGLLVLGALLVPGFALAWGARPSRRRTRRRS